MIDNKILAIVKFNDGEALVLKEEPKLTYRKYGNDTIIGTDGIFYVFYGKESYDARWKAFGGRKFIIELEDGTIEECYGQWWDKVTTRAIKELGVTEENKIVRATASSVDNLKSCYVFRGYNSIKDKLEEFRSIYTGQVYDYYEYEKLLKATVGI